MALPLLSPFVAALVALGLAVLLTLLTLAVVNFLKSAPVIGGWIANKAAVAEQTVLHALGQAFAGIDSFIGASLHALARLSDHFYGTIAQTAHALRDLAHDHLRVSSALHALLGKAHAVARAAHGIDRVLRELVHKYHGIEHRVRTLEHDVTKGIGHDLRLHVKALEHELDHVDHEVIPSLRHAEAEAQAAIENLYAWARGKASLIGVGTLATAIAAVLATLGLDWLRCSNGASRVGRSGCNLWDDLGDVFGLLAAADLALNFETFVHDVQEATEVTVAAVKDVTGLG